MFSCDAIWIAHVPRKVCFFSWLATREVILTVEKHRKRKVFCVSWCYTCKETTEEMDHLLIHCVFTMRLLWDMLQWFRVS